MEHDATQRSKTAVADIRMRGLTFTISVGVRHGGCVRSKIHSLFKIQGSFLKDTFMLLKKNLRTTILFSLLCGLFSFYISNLLEILCYGILTKTQGISYVDKSNMTVLFRPVPFVLLVLFLVVMTLAALFEIGGLLHAFSMAQVGRDTDFLSMMNSGIYTVRKTLHPRNWMVIFFVLVLYPFTSIICISNSYKVEIPSFILQAISASRQYTAIFLVFFLLMLAAEIVFFFSINIFILQKKNFLQSCAASLKLGGRHIAGTILSLIILSMCLKAAINSIASILVVNGLDFLSYFTGEGKRQIGTGAYGTCLAVFRHVFTAALAPAVNNAGCTALFFRYLEERDELQKLVPVAFRTLELGGRRKASALSLLVIVPALIAVPFLISGSGYLLEPVEPPIVCAHRGDNVHAPENTIPAFELCMVENLPWIELDVQQTKDGTVICSHDTTTGRVCGRNVHIFRTTYEELKKLKMGYWMPGNYQDVTYPTLEEVLLLAKKNHVRVQIDIKGCGREKDFEERILKAVEDTGMHDQVMVISIYSNRIKRIKTLDPTIVTAHAVMKAWGNYTQVEDADNLSIELSGVTPGIVHQIHESGMKVFCWTADDEEDIQYLVSCGVDVIGTDNPTMVLDELSRADFSGGARRIFHLAMSMIQRIEK